MVDSASSPSSSSPIGGSEESASPPPPGTQPPSIHPPISSSTLTPPPSPNAAISPQPSPATLTPPPKVDTPSAPPPAPKPIPEPSTPVPSEPQSPPHPPSSPSKNINPPPTPSSKVDPSPSLPTAKDASPPPASPTPDLTIPTPSPPTQRAPRQGHKTPSPPLATSPTAAPSVPTSSPKLSNDSTSSRNENSSSSGPTSSSGSSKSNVGFGTGAVVGVTVAGVLVALVVIIFIVLRKKRKVSDFAGHYRTPPAEYAKSDASYHRKANMVGKSAGSDLYYGSKPPASPTAAGNMYGGYRDHAYLAGHSDPSGSKTCFTYEDLLDITKGFSPENMIGQGGFGTVYKGLLHDGRCVAVKQLKASSGQGEREFRAEVEIIGHIHHRHLVSLMGYCIAEHHRVLVFEFVTNNTLEHHLHGKDVLALDWPKRLKIAIGSARGLAYLHEDCHPRIIHRDIKSANILLDDSFEAKVADFGLAKLTNDTYTHVSTRVMGTFGYMAPEYATSGKLTDKSDVFSFGVVLLELITGRKPVDPSQPMGEESLVEWARPLLVHALETGNYEELVDQRLENNFVKSEMFRMIEVAAACVRHSGPKRPRMVQVLRSLDSEGDISDLSNGVKYGQSTIYNSSQYSADIENFRKLAFVTSEFSTDYSSSGGKENSACSSDSQSTKANHGPVDPSKTEEKTATNS